MTDLAPVIKAVRVSRDAHLRLAAILLGASPVGAVIGFGIEGTPAALGLGLALVGFGLFSAAVALPHLRPERSRLVRLLVERPRDVASVVVVRTRVDVVGVADVKWDVVVKLRDGGSLKLGVFKSALPQVLAAIRARAGLPDE